MRTYTGACSAAVFPKNSPQRQAAFGKRRAAEALA